MSAHTDFAAHFSGALLASTFDCPPGLRTWNGSSPQKRFAVYRNNVVVSLIDALADSYPVVQALVGEEFFRAMAREFIHQSPPRSPVLAWYGEGFADFIAGFGPAESLPYLSDVARIEWLRIEAWHAADIKPISVENFAALLDDVDALPHARITFHPALRVVISAHPVISLWAAHQADDPSADVGKIDMSRGECALLVRPELDVEIVRIDPVAAAFIALLRQGETLAVAAAIGDFDLAATLSLLLRSGAIVGSSGSSS